MPKRTRRPGLGKRHRQGALTVLEMHAVQFGQQGRVEDDERRLTEFGARRQTGLQANETQEEHAVDGGVPDLTLVADMSNTVQFQVARKPSASPALCFWQRTQPKTGTASRHCESRQYQQVVVRGKAAIAVNE